MVFIIFTILKKLFHSESKAQIHISPLEISLQKRSHSHMKPTNSNMQLLESCGLHDFIFIKQGVSAENKNIFIKKSVYLALGLHCLFV